MQTSTEYSKPVHNPLCNKEAEIFVFKLDSQKTLRYLDISDSQEILINLNISGYPLKSNRYGAFLLSKISVLLKLKKLSCYYCDLQELPSSLCEFKNLKYLGCGCNNLKSIPSDFGLLQNLKEFCCSICDLQELPSSLCELKNLKFLDVSHNKLKSLPSDIGLLQKLEFFYIQDNQLESLPFSLGNLSNLKTFHCDNNHLSSFPFFLHISTSGIATILFFLKSLKMVGQTF